jgi:hypothetical protein
MVMSLNASALGTAQEITTLLIPSHLGGLEAPGDIPGCGGGTKSHPLLDHRNQSQRHSIPSCALLWHIQWAH